MGERGVAQLGDWESRAWESRGRIGVGSIEGVDGMHDRDIQDGVLKSETYHLGGWS